MNPDGDKNQNTPDNVPNADPTQQAIFTPAQTPAPEPPRPEQNPSVVVGSVVEPASAPTGLSHQYYSNHPAKTSASGVGDIVIGNGKNRKINLKKPLVIGGIAFVIIIVIAIAVLALNSATNTDKAIAAIFDKYNTTIQDAQTIFADAYREKLTVNEVFNAQFSDKLRGYSGQLEELSSSITKIKPSLVSAPYRDDFTKIQSETINFVNNYLNTVELFNKLYESYNTGDSSNLESLSENENYAVVVLADRFETYLEKKQNLANDISAKRCSMDIAVSDVPATECEYLVDSYRKNLSSMQNSAVVVRTMFSAYDETVYGPQAKLIYQEMQDLTRKLSNTEETSE